MSGWLEDGRLTGRRACADQRPTPLPPSLASYVTPLTLCTTPSLKPQSLPRLASIKPASNIAVLNFSVPFNSPIVCPF